MAEKVQLLKEKMDHSGMFDFKAMYKFAHDWLSQEENYDVIEEKYSEKISGNSKDLLIKWTASKTLSDYFKIEHKLEYEINKLTDIEAELPDGQKKQMQKGKITIEIKSSLIKDPNSAWDKSPINRFLRDVYNKYVIPGRIFSFEQLVVGDSHKFMEEMKAFLELSGRR
jgi:hypothetical protein